MSSDDESRTPLEPPTRGFASRMLHYVIGSAEVSPPDDDDLAAQQKYQDGQKGRGVIEP